MNKNTCPKGHKLVDYVDTGASQYVFCYSCLEKYNVNYYGKN